MNCHSRILKLLLSLACIGSPIFLLPVQADISLAQSNITEDCKKISVATNTAKVCVEARKITVKIHTKKSGDSYQASGILIGKQDQIQNQNKRYIYSILTNAHVLKSLKKRDRNSNNEYQIKTFDEKDHTASIDTKIDWKENDLGILSFSSNINYQTARIGDLPQSKEEEQIYISGFPCETNNLCKEEFSIVSGQSFTRLVKEAKKLDGGYQIGFTNVTKGGMSGGAVLNQNGFLIGINGRGKQQDLGFRSGDSSIPDSNPYLYLSGKSPSEEDIKIFKNLGWAIPIETYKLYTSKNTPNPSDSNQPPKIVSPASSAMSINLSAEVVFTLLIINLILSTVIITGAIIIAIKSLLNRHKQGKPSEFQYNSDIERYNKLPYQDTQLYEPLNCIVLAGQIIIEYKDNEAEIEISIDGFHLYVKKQLIKTTGNNYHYGKIDNNDLSYESSIYHGLNLIQGNRIRITYKNQNDVTSRNAEVRYSEILIDNISDNREKFLTPTSSLEQYKFEKNLKASNSNTHYWNLYLDLSRPSINNYFPLIIDFIDQENLVSFVSQMSSK